MLIEWINIFEMAGAATLATLLLLLLAGQRNKQLSFPIMVGLALACGLGFIAWFTIFNTFALSGLDKDLPIPLFPISPEDMGCGITVLLFTLGYGLLIGALSKNKGQRNIWRQFGVIVWLIPALVALVVDVYFI